MNIWRSIPVELYVLVLEYLHTFPFSHYNGQKRTAPVNLFKSNYAPPKERAFISYSIYDAVSWKGIWS